MLLSSTPYVNIEVYLFILLLGLYILYVLISLLGSTRYSGIFAAAPELRLLPALSNDSSSSLIIYI